MPKLIINRDAIRNNLLHYKSFLPDRVKIIPVIKANAYGAGLIGVGKLLSEIPWIDTISVNSFEEADSLVKNGIPPEKILILGPMDKVDIFAAASQGMQFSITSIEIIDQLKDIPNCFAHILIDSGLNRFGIKADAQLESAIKKIDDIKNIKVIGLFTQHSCLEKLDQQIMSRETALFEKAIDTAKRAGLTFYAHAAASLLAEDNCAVYDAVRIGRGLFIGKEDALSLEATVAAVKSLKSGETAGYGGKIKADGDMLLAIADIGYGHGFTRELAFSNVPVIINGERKKLIHMMMDYCYIDITGSKCGIGDKVIFFGKELPSSEVASCIGEEGVYITAMLNERVTREYI